MNEWKLIRSDIEPTDDMQDAGAEAMKEYHHTGSYGECPGIGWGEAHVCIKAALAAAPQVEIDEITDRYVDAFREKVRKQRGEKAAEAIGYGRDNEGWRQTRECIEAALTAPETNRG